MDWTLYGSGTRLAKLAAIYDQMRIRAGAAINCGWAKDPDDESGMCTLWLHFIPGAFNKMWLYRVIFPTLYFTFSLLFLYYLHRHIVARRVLVAHQKKRRQTFMPRHLLLNASTYVMFLGFVAPILAGIAHMDPWCLFGNIHDLRSYVATHSASYATIPVAMVVIVALSLLDEYVIMPRRTSWTNLPYSIGTLVVMALISAYGTIGYTGFGIALADAVAKDHNTKMGLKGNWMVVATYGLCLLSLLFGLVPLVLELSQRAKTAANPKYAKDIRTMNQRIQVWGIVSFLVCAFAVAQLTQRMYHSDKSLSDTLEQLTWMMVCAILLLFNTALFLSANYIERMPFELWVKLFYRHVLRCEWAPGEDDVVLSHVWDHAIEEAVNETTAEGGSRRRRTASADNSGSTAVEGGGGASSRTGGGKPKWPRATRTHTTTTTSLALETIGGTTVDRDSDSDDATTSSASSSPSQEEEEEASGSSSSPSPDEPVVEIGNKKFAFSPSAARVATRDDKKKVKAKTGNGMRQDAVEESPMAHEIDLEATATAQRLGTVNV
ncbi:MAG: hypothetical protein WC763_06010 [Candidatus Paceibacterota bacterium]|jgi:hypothetical protein